MKKSAPKKSSSCCGIGGKLDTKTPRPGSKEGMTQSKGRRVSPVVKTNLVKPVKKK